MRAEKISNKIHETPVNQSFHSIYLNRKVSLEKALCLSSVNKTCSLYQVIKQVGN